MEYQMKFYDKVNNLIADVKAGRHQLSTSKWISAQIYVKERGDIMKYDNILRVYATREIIRQENGPEEIFL